MSQKHNFISKRSSLSLLLALFIMALVVAACGGAAPAQQSAPTEKEAMAEHEATTGKEEMSDEAMTDTEKMADEAMPDDKAMADTEKMADEAMAEDEAMELPAWFEAELTNVNTGKPFKVADFHNKVVLVETMAVWCTNCLRQQREVQALRGLLGEQPDLVEVTLDIDPNETEDTLKAFTGKNGFDWTYAVAPAEVAREIGQLYGGQFLNPPATPMLIIDRHGQVHPLPFGHKTAQSLQEALAPFLNEG